MSVGYAFLDQETSGTSQGASIIIIVKWDACRNKSVSSFRSSNG